MALLVTRPKQTALELGSRLERRGHSVFYAPMLDIEFRQALTLDPGKAQALLATSANGVVGYVALTSSRDIPVYTVGDKSAETARSAGFETVFSAHGAVEELAELVIGKLDPENGPLLHVGGARLAGDLKQRLERAGFSYRREILYDAHDIEEFPDRVLRALEEETLTGILLFSPHTAGTFKKNIERSGLKAHLKGVTAWCLSQNVADKLAGYPFAACHVASEPTEDSLLTLMAGMEEKSIEDGTREQSVSDKPTDDNQTGLKSKTEAEAASRDASASHDLKKPLPDALTGAGNTVETEAPRTSSGIGRVILAVFVFFCLGLAAWPLLYPKISAYLPEQTRDIVRGYMGESETNVALLARVAALEKAVAAAKAPAATDLSPVQSELRATQEKTAALSLQIDDLKVNTETALSGLSNQSRDEKARIEAIEAGISALKTELAAIEVTAPDTSAVEAGAQSSAEMQSKLSDLQNALEQVTSDVTGLKTGLSSTQAEAADRKSELATLSTVIQSRLEKEASQGGETDEALVLLAIGQLQRTSRTADSFEGAIAQALSVAPQSMQADLAALSSVAKTGTATDRELRDAFTSIANDITQASRLPATETWYGKTLHNLASLVKFRRVDDVSGESVDAVVARAELKLSNNDLAGAVEAAELLTGPPADVVATWLEKAKARLLVDRSISNLLGQATTKALGKDG
ncbi:MAG: uroporphyrinogen-III synthase [Sneathiella sp.]